MSKHYKVHPSGIEPIEIAKYETFVRGNIIKYVMRAPYKGDELGDLEKALDYLKMEIARVKASDPMQPLEHEEIRLTQS